MKFFLLFSLFVLGIANHALAQSDSVQVVQPATIPTKVYDPDKIICFESIERNGYVAYDVPSIVLNLDLSKQIVRATRYGAIKPHGDLGTTRCSRESEHGKIQLIRSVDQNGNCTDDFILTITGDLPEFNTKSKKSSGAVGSATILDQTYTPAIFKAFPVNCFTR